MQETEDNLDKLTDQQILFCREYVKDFNGTRAALEAKYAKSGAHVQASRMLKRDNIKAYIADLIDELSMSADQIIKKQSDIALANLSNYTKVVKREKRKKIRVPYRKKIQEIETLIMRKEKYLDRAILDDQEAGRVYLEIQHLKNSKVAMEIELEDNPSAFVIEWSEPYLEDEIQMDLVSLVKDKEKGLIQSLEWDDQGRPKVSLYSSHVALDKLARIRDLYIEKSEQKIALTKVDKEEINNVFTVEIVPPEQE